jgi:hypothetical protein
VESCYRGSRVDVSRRGCVISVDYHWQIRKAVTSELAWSATIEFRRDLIRCEQLRRVLQAETV